MDETPRGGRAQHRTYEDGTPAGAQSFEGRYRRCAQCHPVCRSDELPEAPGSFLAQFSSPPDAHLGMDSGHTRVAAHPSPSSECLKPAFSGSTSYSSLIKFTKIAAPCWSRRLERFGFRMHQLWFIPNARELFGLHSVHFAHSPQSDSSVAGLHALNPVCVPAFSRSIALD